MHHHTNIIVSEIIGFVNGKFGLREKIQFSWMPGKGSGHASSERSFFKVFMPFIPPFLFLIFRELQVTFFQITLY